MLTFLLIGEMYTIKFQGYVCVCVRACVRAFCVRFERKHNRKSRDASGWIQCGRHVYDRHNQWRPPGGSQRHWRLPRPIVCSCDKPRIVVVLWQMPAKSKEKMSSTSSLASSSSTTSSSPPQGCLSHSGQRHASSEKLLMAQREWKLIATSNWGGE